MHVGIMAEVDAETEANKYKWNTQKEQSQINVTKKIPVAAAPTSV